MHMDTTEEKRLGTYKSASDAVRALYADDTLGQMYTETATAYNLDTEKEHVLTDCFGDAILGIYPAEQVGDALIQKLGLSFGEVQSILAKYGVWIEKIKNLHRLKATPSVPETPVPTPDPSRPLTREDVMQALAQKRTMQGDMDSARNQSSEGAAGPRE